MLYSIKKREDNEKSDELASSQNQVKAGRLQDKLGKQNFHEDITKVFEPVSDTFLNTSENSVKTMMLTSKENNKALENLNNRLLEKMCDTIASCLISPLCKITKSGKTSQFELQKDSYSKRVNDLLIHITIPVFLNDNLLTFRDIGKRFELKRDFLEMITVKDYNVDHASLLDEKLMYEFAKEMYFDVKAQGNKPTRDRSL